MDTLYIANRVDYINIVWCFARRSFNFLMAMVTDQENVVILASKALNFVMYLGDERTRSIDSLEITCRGSLVNRRRDAVRGENYESPLWNLICLGDEDRPACLKG